MLADLHLQANRAALGLEQAVVGLRHAAKSAAYHLLRGKLHATRALCELQLERRDDGLGSARNAAAAFRSAASHPGRRNLAWEDLAEFATRLWRTGEDSLALDLLRESIEGLEAGRAHLTAASYRIKLSSMLRERGQLEEAGSVLPAAEGLSDSLRRAWLSERSRLRMGAQWDDALADSHEAMLLWLSEAGDVAIESAVAKSLVARACLEAGGYEQADSLARKALELLQPWQHPEAAGCRLTRALAVWRRARFWDHECVAEARVLIETAPLLPPAAKARLLQAEAARLQRHGLTSEAQIFLGTAPLRTAPDSPALPEPADVVR
jgi:hypothetical protein